VTFAAVMVALSSGAWQHLPHWSEWVIAAGLALGIMGMASSWSRAVGAHREAAQSSNPQLRQRKRRWADRSDLLGLRIGAVTLAVAVVLLVVVADDGLWGWLMSVTAACIATTISARSDRQNARQRVDQKRQSGAEPDKAHAPEH
jgi:hypothetical protein